MSAQSCPVCGGEPVLVQDPETHGPGQHVNATALILWRRSCDRMMVGRSRVRLEKEWSHSEPAFDRCDLLTWGQAQARKGLAEVRGWRFV